MEHLIKVDWRKQKCECDNGENIFVFLIRIIIVRLYMPQQSNYFQQQDANKSMISLQNFATINKKYQIPQQSAHKKQLEIVISENLQHLKVIFRIKKYPFSSLDSNESYEHFKANTTLQRMIEDLHYWSQKELKLSSLFIVLPYQSRNHLPKIRSFTSLMYKFINKYIRFLTTVDLRNFPMQATSFLLSSNPKFIKSLALLCCRIKKQSLVLFSQYRLNFLQDLSLERCKIGNKGLKTLSKGDWPKLKSLKIKDESLTIDCVKYLKKCCFQLSVLNFLCEDENWVNKLITLQAQTLMLKRTVRLRDYQGRISAFPQTFKLFVFINRIAKRQGIQEYFQRQSDLQQLRAVFRNKVKLY